MACENEECVVIKGTTAAVTERKAETGMMDAEVKQEQTWSALMRQKDTSRDWNSTSRVAAAGCPLIWPPYTKLKEIVLDKKFSEELCLRSDLLPRKRVLTPNGKHISARSFSVF